VILLGYTYYKKLLPSRAARGDPPEGVGLGLAVAAVRVVDRSREMADVVPGDVAAAEHRGRAPGQGGPALHDALLVVRLAAVREGREHAQDPVRVPQRLADRSLRHQLDAVHLLERASAPKNGEVAI
jgi:hypothetical protein